MRVLIVHNRYSSAVPSGENGVVDDEAAWLQAAGVDVDRFEVSNDDVRGTGGARQAMTGVLAAWSPTSSKRFRDHVRTTRPDVVHVHNVFPLLSGSVIAAAHRERLPVAWTVHNYRLTCIAGTHFRDGRPCDDCAHGVPRAAGIRYHCYAGSVPASAAITAGVIAFGASVRRHAVAVPVSQFVADWLVSRRFAPERVRVKYGAVAEPGVATTAPSRSRTIVFAGRLSEEKGVRLLLRAFAGCRVDDARLVVIGSGELEPEVRAAAARDSRIEATGLVPRADVLALAASARAVVIPSVWNEPFPRTAVEALSLGRPVITTGLGGLAETVDDGNGWRTGTDAAAVTDALAAAFSAGPDDVDRRGEASRRRYETQFTPETTTSALISIYEDVIARSTVRSPWN